MHHCSVCRKPLSTQWQKRWICPECYRARHNANFKKRWRKYHPIFGVCKCGRNIIHEHEAVCRFCLSWKLKRHKRSRIHDVREYINGLTDR